MTIGERIRQIRIALGTDDKKMTLEEFGRRLRVSKNTISNIENGNRNLTPTMRKAICDEFHIDEDWLLYGKEGEPVAFVKTPEDAAAAFAKENGLENIEEVLLREYLLLGDDERKTFRNYLKNVLRDLYGADQTKKAAPAASAKKKPSEEMTIDEKVASYRAELEAQEAARMSGASPTGEGEEAVKDA